MNKKKILVLTPRFPYPVVGGDRLRIFNICKELSKYYELTLLSLCEYKSEIESVIPDDGVFSRVERIYHPKWKSFLKTMACLPSAKPLQVAYFSSSLLREQAIGLAKSHDAILAHLIRVGDLIKDVDIPKFLEMTDAISLNYQRVKKQEKVFFDVRSWIYSLESSRLKKYENEVVSYFDNAYLVSDVDRDFLFSKDKVKMDKVLIASNGVDLDNLNYQFSNNARDIVFIGNMRSLQNLDAAIFAASKILPKVRDKLCDVKLRVIGRIGDSEREMLEKYEGVIVVGEVDSISEAAMGAAVGICSVRLGAGVQNKVLEYMALGLPTVSTRCGLEGFHARNGEEVIIADNAEDISNNIIRLIEDRFFAKKIAEAARFYVKKNHSWSSKLEPLINSIRNRLQ